MKLSTLNSKLNLLSVGTNAKTVKGDGEDALTAIMYLSPHTSAGYGNICSAATAGCIQGCLVSAGRGAMSNVIKARKRKTELFFTDNKLFKQQLLQDLILFTSYIEQENLKGYVRLNGTSDIDWSKIKIDHKTYFDMFPDITFYDYTKDFKRLSNYNNYHLTYSKTEETTEQEVIQLLDTSGNVAIVFDSLPTHWNGVQVIDGDVNDLRPLDPVNVIVGLKAKGKAKQDTIGFVTRIGLINV